MTRVRIQRSWLVPVLVAGLVLLMVGAGALASFETGTEGSFWRGLWWTLSLMTTVGFVGSPPTTVAGAVLSVVLMLFGFGLLAFVSAGLASLFVREDVEPFEQSERRADDEIIAQLRVLTDRITALEERLTSPSTGDPESPSDSPADRPPRG